MPKISIIMPLYNAQKYLEDSLDSVLRQTFLDFELICINDASNDNTKQILINYCGMDSRIRVFENQIRLGAAYSRNRGIEEARGKYIVFLDGDDIFEEEMLEVSYACAEKNNLDVLMFGYKHVPSSQIHNKVKIIHGDNYVQKYCKKAFSVEKGKPYEFLLWATSPCNKLFKRSFVVNNEIFFQNLACSNDVYFVNMALLLSRRNMVLNDNRVMIYARDHDEPSRISSRRDPMCCFQAYKHLLEMLINKKKLESFYQHFIYKAFFAFKYVLSSTEMRSKDAAEAFYKFLQEDGVKQLRQLCEDYSGIDENIDCILAKFENSSFESKWYEKESILKVCLKESLEEFKNLFKNRTENSKIAVWGTGQIGQLVLENCKEQGIPVDYVVDISKEKQEMYVVGYCVQEPSEVVDKVDTIIVAAYKIFNQVEQFVRQHGSNAEIIDIHNYMSII